MSKHTPGPWYVTKNPTWLIRSTPGKCAVGKATEQFMDRAERDANARLIAAAPTMLEALKALVDKPLRYNGNMIEIECNSHGAAMALVKSARAAIALAEGE